MTAPDPRLDEIQARLDAATPGPWEEFWRGHIHARDERGTVSICQTFGPEDQIHHDAEFITNAPADVSYLLAELRKAHEALTRVETLAERAESHGNLYVFVDDLTSAVAAANGDGEVQP